MTTENTEGGSYAARDRRGARLSARLSKDRRLRRLPEIHADNLERIQRTELLITDRQVKWARLIDERKFVTLAARAIRDSFSYVIFDSISIAVNAVTLRLYRRFLAREQQPKPQTQTERRANPEPNPHVI